ncbi:folylpolyglutamate synthetase, partial [Kipferlia bialata]
SASAQVSFDLTSCLADELGLTLEGARPGCTPTPDTPLIAHIAGTKGKGSVSTMLAARLNKAGHKVGLYTSPHLVSVTERIVVGGVPVPPQTFSRALWYAMCSVSMSPS